MKKSEKETIKEVLEVLNAGPITVLPDRSAFCTGSLPLPQNHWLYDQDNHGVSPAPFRIGINDPLQNRDEWAEKIRTAARWAIQASTVCGKDPDFDPDAMVQNFVVGMIGYWTQNGFLEEEAKPNDTQPRG